MPMVKAGVLINLEIYFYIFIFLCLGSIATLRLAVNSYPSIRIIIIMML